jgi:hypothetical protein
MSNNADVFVSFGEGEKSLIVKCIITFDTPITDFRFSLSTLLTIDNVSTNTDSEWKIIKEWQTLWQHKCNEIEVSSKLPMQKLTIEYHGRISGWCNIIEDKRSALSIYSAWTIFETSIPLKFIFKIEKMEDYLIINARYDVSEKLWIYGETDHDIGNIIALKNGRYHVENMGNFNYYYLNEAEKAYADNYTFYYNEILKFYSSVFNEKTINKINIVSLGLEEGDGAYFRKELIVIDKINISEDKDAIRKNTISLLGHELGHNWFKGADITTWEDWLNETGAEWAALLYILSLNDKEYFESHLSWAKEKYKDTPVIKSPDSKRPDEGVHIRGVMLFYEIYCKYGAETILKILQILADLKEVKTNNFLSELRGKVDEKIPELIERGLTIKDYTELFH